MALSLRVPRSLESDLPSRRTTAFAGSSSRRPWRRIWRAGARRVAEWLDLTTPPDGSRKVHAFDRHHYEAPGVDICADGRRLSTAGRARFDGCLDRRRGAQLNAGVTASPRRCKDRSSTSRVPDPFRARRAVSRPVPAPIPDAALRHACKARRRRGVRRRAPPGSEVSKSGVPLDESELGSSIPDQVDHVFGVAISNDTRMSRSVVLSRMSHWAPGTQRPSSTRHMSCLGLRPQGRRTLEESLMSSIIRVDHSTMARPFASAAPDRRPVEEIESDVRLEFRSRVLAAGCVIHAPAQPDDRPKSATLWRGQRDQVWLRLRQGIVKPIERSPTSAIRTQVRPHA